MKKKISYQIIFSVIRAYGIIITLSVILFSFVEFRNFKKEVFKKFDHIKNTFSEPFKDSLFVMNHEMTKALALGLKNDPLILDLKVQNQLGKIIVDLSPDTKKRLKQNTGYNQIIEYKLELYYKVQGKKNKVGTVFLFSESRIVYNAILSGVIRIMSILLFSIVVIWLVLWFSIKRILGDPIQEFISEIKKMEGEGNIKMIDFKYDYNNELKLLEDSFNDLSRGIHQSHDETKNLLIKNEGNLIDLQNQKSKIEKSSKHSMEIMNKIIKKSELIMAMAHDVEEVVSVGMEIQENLGSKLKEIEKTTNKLSFLVEAIKETGKKSQKVQAIVSESKMLSFNAEIEAAHAGQFGLGFTVVASEMANLAMLSGKISGEISKTVNFALEENIKIMNEANQSIKEGTETAKESKDYFFSIEKTLMDMFVEINTVAKHSIELEHYAEKEIEDLEKDLQEKKESF